MKARLVAFAQGVIAKAVAAALLGGCQGRPDKVGSSPPSTTLAVAELPAAVLPVSASARAVNPRITSARDGWSDGSARDGWTDGLARARIYVLAGSVEVMTQAVSSSPVLGSIRAGGSVELASAGALQGADAACPLGFYALALGGFLCRNDGVTLDAGSAALRVLGEYRLAEHAVLPASYGLADLTPVYFRVPTVDEQMRAEPGVDEHLRRVASLHQAKEAARAAGRFLDARDDPGDRAGVSVPDDLRGGLFAPFAPKAIAPGSPVTGVFLDGAKVSFLAGFDTPDRSWLVTPELLFVPRDKVKQGVVSGFHGVEVPQGAGVAFMGIKPEHKFIKGGSKRQYLPVRDTWAPSQAVLLAEPAVRWTDDKFLDSLEPGFSVRIDDVIVAHPTPAARWGLDPSVRWIEINGKTHVLLIHERGMVTFATLVSVGRMDTPRGKYRIVSKHLTASIPFERTRNGVKAEVPEVMLLSDIPDGSPPVTVFAGWWMSAWGVPHGGSGVALAPLDARRLFDRTAPALPEAWHSVWGEGTWVVLHD